MGYNTSMMKKALRTAFLAATIFALWFLAIQDVLFLLSLR